MDFLLRDPVRWREPCLTCGKNLHMNAAEARAAYGLASPVDAVRAEIRARCSAERCPMNNGADHRWPSLNLPPAPIDRKRREPEWPHG
jgi:hypothetical protein